AAVELLVGIDHAPRRIDEPLALGKIARIGDQRADGRLGLLTRWPRRRRRCLSDMLRKLRLAQRLNHSVHNGLSVRRVPTPRTGCAPGAAASAGAHQGLRDPLAPTGRRIPIIMAWFRGLRNQMGGRAYLPCCANPTIPYILL